MPVPIGEIPSFKMSSFDITEFNREAWLAAKLGLTDYDVGLTTREQRRERIRAVILERDPDTVCARPKGQPVITLRAAFKRTYSMPLVTDELDFGGENQEVA